MRQSVRITGILILTLLAISAVVWSAVLRESRHGILTVSFLDVGQGDSILIESPSGLTALIDGGPTAGVLREIGKQLPWYDRSIDVIIPTHPDADHITGLIDVLERYKVSNIIQSSVEGDTATWRALEDLIRERAQKGTRVVTADRGQIIDLGSGVYLEVLSPDREVPDLETNTGCVVTRLVYGDTSFMLSCDAPQAIEKYLVSIDGADLRSDVLKAGHHGSKTSSAPIFVGYIDPQYAVYSRGCDNMYGMPHKETVATYKAFNIPTLDTCTIGTIVFTSDGQQVALR
ncbi:MBL fold metallo-hydrolase [Candidatus Kaiserbacteria bacterium]|nr:MBL fold metallo-hydrolase [Candidatus Kaiserbacteria bacterium]